MTQQLAEFDKLKSEIQTFLQPVSKITVTDAASNAIATGTLRTVLDLKKQIETHRVAYVKPLNDEVKRVNDYAKGIVAPLVEAETLVKKVMGEHACRVQEAIIAERRRADEAAAAARAKAEEKAAEERAELKRQQKQEAEAMAAFGVASDPEAQLYTADEIAQLEKRQQAEALEQDLRAKQEVRRIEAERPKNTRQVPTWKIADPALVPDQYWMINEALLGAEIRGGAREIPGVEIRMETRVVGR